MNPRATTTRLTARAGLVLALFLVVGCGSDEKLSQVSGTVTYDGKPVPAGTIFFDPVAGGAKSQGFATIKNGEFDTAQGGRGLGAGKFQVRVLGFDGKEANDAPLGRSLFPEHTQSHEQTGANATLDIKVLKTPKGQ